MSELGSTSNVSSSAAQVDFLDLCKLDVKCIQNLVAGRALLNRRQCRDLSSKLSHTILNVQELVVYCGASSVLFRPALGNLYRHLEKANALVSSCAEKDWCAAAVFQCQNENAFREVLLDVGFCYNAMYELAKSKSKDWCDPPEDLRESSILEAASDSDVDGDKQDLQKRLDELANGHTRFKPSDYIIPGRVARKQSVAQRQRLANHLLVKMYRASKEPQARTLEAYAAIMWRIASEPAGTWGNSHFLGSGSGASGVCSTTWLGIPCAKKVFDGDGSESSFMKEAGILAHLKHPCIVNFICCGNGLKKGDRFIAMELMEMSLFDLIEERKRKGEHFSVGVAVDVMVQMARGVCYLHGEGVAHRDLKPQNVVLNKINAGHEVDHYCVKLVDFGVSKSEVEVSKSNTMTYGGIGTTMYRAVEAHPKANPGGGGKVNWFRADAYSFAMTCAHLLSLEVPFKNTRPNELYDELIKNGRRPRIPDMYPKDLVLLLKDCWKTNPRSRPSFVEICERLEGFCYKYMKSYSSSLDGDLEDDGHDYNEGLKFIKMKMKFPNNHPLIDVAKGGSDNNDYVSIISCTCGCTLQHLSQSPYPNSGARCNMCIQRIVGEEYHCEACHFHAHPHCGEIKDEVEVSFHNHTLHLLVEEYYMDKPDVICFFCEESVQLSKWVYRCEQCAIDVHALCTKFSKEIQRKRLHQHALILRQCPPRKSLTCTCCNGEVKEYTWRYTCPSQQCAIDLHPLCTFRRKNLFCIFDTSHRLVLNGKKRSFYCARCGALGASWSYHCETCDVDIHVDCLDYMDEAEVDKWIRAYETFMLENESKDHYTKMNMLLELVDKVPISNALEAGSSPMSYSQQVITRAQPLIQRPTSIDKVNLNALDKDANLQRQIVVETKERIKAKKIGAKEARQKSSTNLLDMLEKLENTIVDVHSSGSNMSQDEVQTIAATHEELKRKQHLVEDQMAKQMQSKMGQGPRTVVFSIWREEDGNWKKELLTYLQADMEKVSYDLLCEEPNHKHVILDVGHRCRRKFGEERAEKLQPLLASGLDVVRRILSTLEPHELKFGLASAIIPRLDAGYPWDLQVNVPCLDDRFPWDLRALEVYQNRIMDPCDDAKEVEELKRAEDCAAEWFRNHLEYGGKSMLETYGLQRVRYKLISREDEGNKHKHSDIAWICKDHVNSGLEDGALELFPLKYYNAKDDHRLRLPYVRFKE